MKLLVEELELESSADEDSLDFEIDDLIVNLPLDGSDFTLASTDVAAGVFDEFEMEIEHDDDGYTVVIKGIYNGEEFTYQSEEDFEIELDFNPPLEINDDSSPAITINVDPTGWFKDSSGNDLYPNDPANGDRIDDNIENSFDVEEDDEDDDNNDDSDKDGDNDD